MCFKVQNLKEKEQINKSAMQDPEKGLRVVRGPDWIWGDQDGGEGGVGTIVGISGDGDIDFGTVMVYWDTGKLANYRAGHDEKFDLLAFDSAPAGKYK